MWWENLHYHWGRDFSSHWEESQGECSTSEINRKTVRWWPARGRAVVRIRNNRGKGSEPWPWLVRDRGVHVIPLLAYYSSILERPPPPNVIQFFFTLLFSIVSSGNWKSYHKEISLSIQVSTHSFPHYYSRSVPVRGTFLKQPFPLPTYTHALPSPITKLAYILKLLYLLYWHIIYLFTLCLLH